MAIRAILTAACALIISGCALSPQHVTLSPRVTVNDHIAVAHIVQLHIEDKRPQQHLGTRGGVYSETSYIYPQQSLPASLRPAAIRALQELGLQTEGLSPQPIQLTLTVEELSYRTDDSKLPKKVALSTRIHARVIKGEREHEGRFNSSKTYSFVKSPSTEENQKIINELLSETMTRLFNDPKLLNFIRG